MKRYLVILFIHFSMLMTGQELLIKSDHPRLFWSKENEQVVIDRINSNPQLNTMSKTIIAECDRILQLDVSKREMKGRRLWKVASQSFRRLGFLSYAWRVTGKDIYAKRAEQEMIAISEFNDWNPSHFLDVAEMTLGVALAYDWLYDYLSEDSKKIIRGALFTKGVKYATKPQSWMKSTNNWNQVCNGAMAIGAIAIYESYPDSAATVIKTAINAVRIPMETYGPNGSYQEGPGYWQYGTGFNVMFLEALRSAFGTDFNLLKGNNFLKTPFFIKHMVGPVNQRFNFGDNHPKYEFEPIMTWFAKELNNVSLIDNEIKALNSGGREYIKFRYSPLALIWMSQLNLDGSDVQKDNIPLYYLDNGETPVVAMRSSWDKDAYYVALKAGKANGLHGHMDVGTFVIDAKGVRWAMDFGPERYNDIESQGINLWDKSQRSERWKLQRYRNQSHNTLTFNDEMQLVNQATTISEINKDPMNMSAYVDLTPVYRNSLQNIGRTISLINKNTIRIEDKITGSDRDMSMRWNMLTGSKVKIIDKNKILLSKDGQQLMMTIESEHPFMIKKWSTKPDTEFESPNDGTIFIGFESLIPAGKEVSFNIIFQ